jgi:hypothetical protein
LSSISTTEGPEPLVLRAHFVLQLRVFHAPAHQVDQIKVIAGDAPGRADAVIAELGRLVGGVPALHDALELRRQGTRRVVPEPGPFDQAAAQWCRGLLVLAGEIIFADHLAQVLEHRERLARRVQCLALMPGQEFRSPDRLGEQHLVDLGDRRKADDLPIFLGQHLAHQIVLVQAVHDHDDGARDLVVEPAVEGMVEPLVGRPALGLGQCLLGLQRVVDDDQVGAAPGQHAADRGREPAA